jgi:hypothetical protein
LVEAQELSFSIFERLIDCCFGSSVSLYQAIRTGCAEVTNLKRRLAISRHPGIATKSGNHSFRATGITEYLRNGVRREIAPMANHESARTTGLYDRRDDAVSLDEIERIII